MNPEAHSSGNGPQQRGAPDNSIRLANGLFALAVAGAFLFVLLLAVRNAAPPGLAYFPLSSALVIVQVALLTVTFFGLGVALRRGHRLHRPARQLTKRSAWLLLAVWRRGTASALSLAAHPAPGKRVRHSPAVQQRPGAVHQPRPDERTGGDAGATVVAGPVGRKVARPGRASWCWSCSPYNWR